MHWQSGTRTSYGDYLSLPTHLRLLTQDTRDFAVRSLLDGA